MTSWSSGGFKGWSPNMDQLHEDATLINPVPETIK